MNKYVNLNALYDEAETLYDEFHSKVLALPVYTLEAALEDDVVKIVRCKDCKHSCMVRYAFGSEMVRTCRALGVSIGDDEFCSIGERKEDD